MSKNSLKFHKGCLETSVSQRSLTGEGDTQPGIHRSDILPRPIQTEIDGCPRCLGVNLVEDVDIQGNPIYQAGWNREIGPIFLQEHDTKVEFTDVEIDAGWLPGGGNFDPNWQRTFQNGNCT